jgi:hypothetical protein
VNGYAVVIVWQSTDYYGEMPPTVADTQIPTRTPFPCPANDNNSTGGGGLSLSDKIFIAIGLGVGVPSLMLALWSGCYTRRQYLSKRERERSAPEVDSLGARWEGSEAEGEDLGTARNGGPPAQSPPLQTAPRNSNRSV